MVTLSSKCAASRSRTAVSGAICLVPSTTAGRSPQVLCTGDLEGEHQGAGVLPEPLLPRHQWVAVVLVFDRDMVLPRSAFSQNLPQLLRRHGAPEDEARRLARTWVQCRRGRPRLMRHNRNISVVPTESVELRSRSTGEWRDLLVQSMSILRKAGWRSRPFCIPKAFSS